MATIMHGERIGKDGQLSVACSAVLFDPSRQRILLTRRQDDGRWSLPGGRMEPGEDAAEACVREVGKEYGSMAGDTGAESVMNLDTFLTEINRTYGRPALVAGVTDQDRLRAAGAIGVRRLGHDVPVTVQDQFHIGSVGKAIAGTVIAVLVDQGRLSWETTPADVFPDLAATMDPAFREVGIVRFLTHQAGLAPFTEDAEWQPFAAWSSPPMEQRRAFTAHLLRRPPAVPPGTEFLYSNAGFTVAAAMAERVTGHLWEALVQSSIFTPLEMVSAGFGWPAHAQRDAPWGHWVTDQGFQPDPPEDALRLGPLLGPAGDLHMNVADLARFARVHLRGLAGQDSVVQATSIRTLYRALGYYARGAQKVGYVGSAGTFTAVLLLMPPRNQALVLMTNAGDDADSALATRILDALSALVAAP